MFHLGSAPPGKWKSTELHHSKFIPSKYQKIGYTHRAKKTRHSAPVIESPRSSIKEKPADQSRYNVGHA